MKRISAWISLEPRLSQGSEPTTPSQTTAASGPSEAPAARDQHQESVGTSPHPAGESRSSCWLSRTNSVFQNVSTENSKTTPSCNLQDDLGVVHSPDADVGHVKAKFDVEDCSEGSLRRDVAAKVHAARECKRLLDTGRRAFLEDMLGLDSELVHFVGKDVTPENVLLLAYQR